MHILILGAGQVGCNIARSLVSMDNHITVVDQDELKLQKLSEDLDIQPVVGYAAHPNVLDQAGAQNADVLISVTNNDEVNIVACEVAHSVFQVPIKIARIRDRFYLEEKYRGVLYHGENISIDYVISPEADIAKMMSHSLQVSGATSVVDVWDQAYFMCVCCQSSSPIVNTPLRLLFSLFPTLDISVVAILRGAKAIIPKPNDIIQKDDRVYFIVPKVHISQAMEAFGHENQEQSHIVIAGGGNIGSYIAREVHQKYPAIQIKMVEKSFKRIEELSHYGDKIDILLGDVCDQNILLESGIDQCDTFMAVTNDDKTNILSALMAKHYKAKKTMALLSDKSLHAFAGALGIDMVIDPNAITLSSVLRYVRQNRLKSIYSIEDIEILEIEVTENSGLVGLSTTDDVLIPGQIMVAALKREDNIFPFPENFTINAHDQLIIAVMQDAVYKVEGIVSDYAKAD